MAPSPSSPGWQFWIDRGGTFTDIVAQRPDGDIVVHKLLSENPRRYQDAPLQGIREILGLSAEAVIPAAAIAAVKMGTTVATNALLERRGDPTVLVTTAGFRDAWRIGYQNRPDIFARHIQLPEMLYSQVIEVRERYSASGEILIPLTAAEEERLLARLTQARQNGLSACAVVLMHGYRYPDHENRLADLARQAGFKQISVSHQVSPLIKLISRGDITVVDAYLSPILRRYIDRIAGELTATKTVDAGSSQAAADAPQLMFMQSNGGLTDAQLFQGKDSILSGPAGGVVGAVQTSLRAGYAKAIGFDMGGTSTDVSHYGGDYERTFETEVAGVRLRAPMMSIHTVAAGGGSILSFDGSRYRVGPESAGAYPGPACYRNGGPLAVTDCNVMVGKLRPEFFPAVFGPSGDQPLDREAVRRQFTDLAERIRTETGDTRTPEQVAAGFLAIAIEKMANAIKKVSVQRGYDVSEYVLCCFGGAGGQHACLIADALGMKEIFLHPFAGVLSAYGMGLANIRSLHERSLEVALVAENLPDIQTTLNQLSDQGKEELLHQGIGGGTEIEYICQLHLKYEGTDTTLAVPWKKLAEMRSHFETTYRQRYGFAMADKRLIVATASVEVIGHTAAPEEPVCLEKRTQPLAPRQTGSIYTANRWQEAPLYHRDDLLPGDHLSGPALIIEATGTTVLEPGWQATLNQHLHLILSKASAPAATQKTKDPARQKDLPTSAPDPVMLEIFNNLFRSVAEEMGVTLQNTSYSVNIKERLDFSCAVFDQQGQLVANAPHIPVHLGSMGESVQSLIRAKGDQLRPGDAYMLNNPYNGGTHLPDITVITPVFLDNKAADRPDFFTASRGHHADVGGVTPGSMPPTSTTIEAEGVLIDNFLLVEQGQFRQAALLELLTQSPYPVRNSQQNIADLQAQLAANEKGAYELRRLVEHYGLAKVQAYMQHVQDNAEECVRRVIDVLKEGRFTYPMDDGSQIQLQVSIDRHHRSARIDFSGTSPQRESNFNAPAAVCKAAVLYVFRTLVADDIPLNAGCLKPLEVIIPEGCMLNPRYPAAVVAGNVETSQAVTDALYGALGVMAASQGTMNNFTFGNERHQYYETICGGSGAGPDFDGTDAVHTHMTNSRLTDPEVLEWRFPVLLERFEVRQGSGGDGAHPGGNGIVRQIQFREPMQAAILSGHRKVPPFGLQGGEPGQVGRNALRRADGTLEELPGQAVVSVEAGDSFIIETPGGGGFGRQTDKPQRFD